MQAKHICIKQLLFLLSVVVSLQTFAQNTNFCKYKEIQYPTPNYDSLAVNKVEGVILHHTATKTVKDALKILTDTAREVSCHVVIDTDGTRYILCPPEVVAWHAGKSILNERDSCNKFCVGIEFQGNTLKRPLTEAQVESAIEWLTPILQKYKIPYNNIVTHQMVRQAYIDKYAINGKCEGVYHKVDITPKEYKHFMAALRRRLPEQTSSISVNPQFTF